MYNDAAQVIASPMLSREVESNATVQNRLRRSSNGEIVRGDETALFDTDHDIALIRAHVIMPMIPQRALALHGCEAMVDADHFPASRHRSC